MKSRRTLSTIVSFSLLLTCVGCGGEGGETEPDATRTTLRVPLYPYIPDAAGDAFSALTHRIEAEFELAHPEVDLVINPGCFEDDFYDPESMSRGLSGESECSYDVAEVDTMLLGEMVAAGAIRPWSALPGVDWHPAAITNSTHDGELFGVPHWLCAHYIFSRDEDVRAAGTVSALLEALEALKTPAPNMSGNMLGSWNLPSLYLDAWADTNGTAEVASAVSTTEYDADVLQSLQQFAKACEDASGNPCIDGTYDLGENFDLPAQRFAKGEADASFGYSERLHTILKSLDPSADAAAIKISTAPLGNGDNTLLFTDSFVVSKRCTGDCAEAAAAFVEYMSAQGTYEWILMSEDAAAEGRIPRYLMPASLDAYAAPKIAEDPYYAVIKAETQSGVSFPNEGVLGKKDAMQDDILNALKPPQP